MIFTLNLLKKIEYKISHNKLIIITHFWWCVILSCFKSIDFSDFYNRLTELNFFWIYLSMFISIFEHVIGVQVESYDGSWSKQKVFNICTTM